MDSRTIVDISIGQRRGFPLGKPAQFSQNLENAHIVGPIGQFRRTMRPRQHRVLNHEFDIDHTAAALLEMEFPPGLCGAGKQLFAHAITHLNNIQGQFFLVPGLSQNLPAKPVEALAQGRIAGHKAGPNQGLVFPGPGGIQLIFPIGVEGNHQHARVSRWPQAHVTLIELAHGGSGSQDIDDLLTQPRVEQGVVQGPLAVGLALQ